MEKFKVTYKEIVQYEFEIEFERKLIIMTTNFTEQELNQINAEEISQDLSSYFCRNSHHRNIIIRFYNDHSVILLISL